MLQTRIPFDFQLFENIMNSITDGIYISDKNGITLWVNKASESMCRRKKEELIGRSVWELEKEGVFNPSATRMALESGNSISTVQSMNNGRKFLVTGHLIYGKDNQLELVVAHSRDITQTVRTTSQLEEAEALLQRYSQEIKAMKLGQKLDDSENPLVGKSKAHRELLDFIYKVASLDTTILITGETGVGKNVIARHIHHLSNRNEKPFIELNCGAIPESLLESELFGYKKGAFTGASASGKIGLVKMAEGGTLFLDEIGELPLHLQAKILQLLQNKTYIPIGDTQLHRIDVRIIAATNRNLTEMIEQNLFRKDLYYRLNILPVHVPPLRERPEDILHLLHFYLHRFNKQYQKNRIFSGRVLQLLQNYEWQGNVRELENLVERLVITSSGNEISVEDLPNEIKVRAKDPMLKPSRLDFQDGETLPEYLQNIERDIIQEYMQRYQSTRKAARALGVTQTYIMRRIKKYKL